MSENLVPSLVEELVKEILEPGRPVIVDGFMIFTDGTILQFTDNTVLYFGE